MASPAQEPSWATTTLAVALTDVLARRGITAAELAEQLGPRWRFLRHGASHVDGRALRPDDLARLRRALDLPPGYFAEERELAVIRTVRDEPELRDRLYFALAERAGADAAAATAVEGAVDEPVPGDGGAFVPLAPPTFRHLVVVVLDVSEASESQRATAVRAAIDDRLRGLLDDLTRSQEASNFDVSFVAYNLAGVASTPPASPSGLREPGFLEALWRSVQADPGVETDPDATPPLARALDVACARWREFSAAPAQVPISATVLVLAPAAQDVPQAVAEATAGLEALSRVTVVPIDLGALPGDRLAERVNLRGDASGQQASLRLRTMCS